jgi:hypothetical protein
MAVIDRPVRFDIRLPQELADDMQAIENQTGLSRAEIFRRSVALYKRLKKAQTDDASVLVMEKNGTLKEIVGF